MASLDYPLGAHPSRTDVYSHSEAIYDLVTTTDHKKLGLLYIGTAILFFAIAGIMAAMIRLQLALPDLAILDPATYNRLFTMHGTTMVFFVGMPIVAGLSNYLIPLMIGARDMAFPRLNAFGYWAFLFGALVLYFSYLGGGGMAGSGSAPDVGWFAYAPLSGRAFSRGHGTDYWVLGILISGLGSMASAINVLATVLCMRCPGMTLMRMPIFVWLMAVDAWLILIAVPPLNAAQIMLMLDRYLGAAFFDTQRGGSAVLWQHFFWIFGHPEVYILIFPAFATMSEIVPVFARKPLFGRPAMVGATIAIAFISLTVWAHHMFTVGMPAAANSFFVAATMLIAVPTGIKNFNWIATMWGGTIRMTTAMLFCIGFLFDFIIGGLTGVMLATAPLDWQLHNSYFLVAHFHFVLIGGLIFMVFAAVYYWFPKATGRMLSEKLGKWHFALFVIGFNLTFIPLHFLGILGMPRRIYTYPTGRGWEFWNGAASIGVVFQAAGVLCFVWNIFTSLRSGRVAGDDPWDAWTLEWATSSPPPAYNFEKIPVIRSARPLWDMKHPEDPDWKFQ